MPRLWGFCEVFLEEIVAINGRRAAQNSPPIRLEIEDFKPDGERIYRPTAESKVVGLALSGGGIRSAAFCLGALQALENGNVLKKVDYLSTVSGGGYIGTAVSAAMSTSRQATFPFLSALRQVEMPGVQHIRDHSNYLFPRGFMNVFYNVAIYLRGLASSWALIMPFVLFPAALTIWIKPTLDSLNNTELAGYAIPLLITPNYMTVTSNLAIVFGMFLLTWALWRSRSVLGGELHGPWPKLAGVFLVGLLFSAFCEIQPIILRGMFFLAKSNQAVTAQIVEGLKYLSGVLAALSIVVGFFGRFFADIVKTGLEKPTVAARVSRVLAKFLIYMAAASIPFLIWFFYIQLTFWGISDTDSKHVPSWLPGFTDFWLVKSGLAWLLHLPPTLQSLYLVFGIVFLLVSLVLTPNANSLHRLYRDRLSKAFLFNPDRRENEDVANEAGVDAPTGNGTGPYAPGRQISDLTPLDQLRLGDIVCNKVPYQIINAAVNLRGSKYANRRGRNADFFFFSSRFVGSEATRYVTTGAMEACAPELDLATAMAVSGAAASSNMGANTISALAPTFALLNVRLGFWLPNPIWVATRQVRSHLLKLLDQFYIFNEMFGLLREDSGLVYLSDGGHIENLGVYELLRRRCRIIIAIDAEADPQMNFNSLIVLQRYARIDLGITIDLPWEGIRDTTRSFAEKLVMKSGQSAEVPRSPGPHCAIGEIEYPNEGKGIFHYVKSSLSGDENDYILDYKRRYSAYPHETTADQLFSEEQFEVYRALGFHALQCLFANADRVSMRAQSTATGPIPGSALISDFYDVFGLEP